MKSKLTLSFLLKATLACIALTIVEFFFRKYVTGWNSFKPVFEMTAAWIIVAIAWAIYFLDIFKNRYQNPHRTNRSVRVYYCRGDHWSPAGVQCTPLRLNSSGSAAVQGSVLRER